jgi:16S rRNA G527 N7-methylase RsmG
MTAVDLGSNIGFFSLYLSEHLKEILLVEFNEYLSNMARMTADYLAINNVTFLDDSIETVFLSNVKYDLVLALAIHQYLDLDRSEVLSSLVKKTNSGGFILIESHPEDNFIDYILGEIELFNLSVLEYGPIDDQGGRIRTFILLKLGKEYE